MERKERERGKKMYYEREEKRRENTKDGEGDREGREEERIRERKYKKPSNSRKRNKY